MNTSPNYAIQFLLCFLFLLTFSVGFSQTEQELEKLKKEILKENNLEKKFKLQDSFIFEMQYVNPDTFLAYAYPQVDLAIQLMKFDTAAETAAQISYVEVNHKQNKEAGLDIVNKLLPYEDKFKSTKSKGLLYAKLGGIHFKYSDFETAIDYYQKAISKYGPKDSLFIADMHFFSGQAYSSKGMFLEALSSLEKSYGIYTNKGDSEYAQHSLGAMTNLYSMNGLYEKALQEYKRIDSLAAIDSNLVRLYSNAFNASVTYRKMGNLDLELESLKKAQQISIESSEGNPQIPTFILSAMSTNYAVRGDLNNAKVYLDSLQNNYDKNTDFVGATSRYITAHIEYYMAINDLENAKSFIDQKLLLTSNWDDFEAKMYANKYAASYYERLNKPGKAFQYLKKYNHLKDSLESIANLNQLLYYQTAFETEQREKEIIIQREENLILKAQREKIKRWWIGSTVGLVILCTFVYLMITRKNALKEKVLQESFTQRLIEQQEEEKKRVSESLHDSLGQSLLLIKNKVYLTQDKMTQEIVDQAIAEVSTISKALHPLQLEQLGLTMAIENTIRSVDENSDIFFSSELENVDELFTNKEALNIYRITQESLNNIVKHSEATAARIELKSHTDNVTLHIRDNGKGFDFTEEYQKLGSLGLKTLKGRVSQLGGTMTFNSTKQQGTELLFRFPA